MPDTAAPPVQIDLTPEQQSQYYQINGLRPLALVITRQSLCALLMYTEVQRRGMLTDSPQLTSIIQLTPEQAQIIRQATGQEASHLTLLGVKMDQAVFREDCAADSGPIAVGRSLLIVPAKERRPASSGKHVIALSAESQDGRAIFGTGTNPTTRLSLMLLEERLAPAGRVLDLGTGSGILAIAAAKLGAREVTALDTDPQAVITARRNVRLNRLSGLIQVSKGSIEAARGAPYDLVAANLFASILLALAPDLGKVVRPGGTLVASGLREAAADAVADALRAQGFRLEDHRTEGGWAGLALVRN